MTSPSTSPSIGSLDGLLYHLETLQSIPELSDLVTLYQDGDYRTILQTPASQSLMQGYVENLNHKEQADQISFAEEELGGTVGTLKVFIIGLAAFDAFLQANVTGPPSDWHQVYPAREETRAKCLKDLEVDGVSIYQHIPHIELFCLARHIFTHFFPREIDQNVTDCKWMRLRINSFHQRMLSTFSGGRLSDSDLLQDKMDVLLKELDEEILSSDSEFLTGQKVQYLLEKVQTYIMQGLESKAREELQKANKISGFKHVLSGALGKKTKFQEDNLSQLVVFAKSKCFEEIQDQFPSTPNGDSASIAVPEAFDLNDDTLLESISFVKTGLDKIDSKLHHELSDLEPDNQPNLSPLDQIILLAEATLKDNFSPLDALKSEEILPYATRVLMDKPTNWQIYTQALIVRSRIESHRSRTKERSILQLQAVVDQIIADTQENLEPKDPNGIPEIQITSFLPKAKPHESAPVWERLKYVHSLNTPSRFELETELAYAWAAVGSMFSALEIFKRLHLWAEVALCYHSASQEDKARRIIRRQLYYSDKGDVMDHYDIGAPEVATEEWKGDLRPSPPHAPRLWCILGDLDNDPECWKRAWEISNHRFARAQRTLGEYWVKSGDLEMAREAYILASSVNRQNEDTWSRLGDLNLKLGKWDDAIASFQYAITLDDRNATTYSNLGSALISKHKYISALQKAANEKADSEPTKELLNLIEEEVENSCTNGQHQDPKVILEQAMRAFKRGATLAHTNWRMWDNVLTVALNLCPPSFPDVLLALRNIVRIRAPSLGEKAVDIDALSRLIAEVTSQEHVAKPHSSVEESASDGIYMLPRGTLAFNTLYFLETDVIPLITARGELYELAEKMALYRKDFAGALEFAEKAWRSCMRGDAWLLEEPRWAAVVRSTVRLVDGWENYGPMLKVKDGMNVETMWKAKARKALQAVLRKGVDTWEESEGWQALQARLDDL
ncbi:unnamed protein product [Blumeria hordei]|uniref:Uncharacterized protein n=1 Tax=Blumeria hordei TaxID=2867405 RepID=A0A383UIY6_BLUHO|nr:unnamed protein product [Blumeria hordei]